jgi:hypothetical protein
MAIMNRIVCSMNQNVKHLYAKNGNGSKSSFHIAKIPNNTQETDLTCKDCKKVKKSNSYYASHNNNLIITTNVIDEGDRVVIIRRTEWFDSKLGKLRSQISQNIYNV